MDILAIKRSKSGGSIKIYGTILGDSGKTYRFGYIRRRTFRGWICSCESFLLNQIGKNRNCKHLRHVRTQYGRFGALVPKS